MKMKDNREKLSKYKYSIRLSQLITTFGPGAIMDFMNQPLMTVDHSKWKAPIKIYEERLQKRLHVKGFKLPQDSDSGYNVPFTRFPQWYYCPNCRRFMPIEEWEKEYNEFMKDRNYKEKKHFMENPVCTKHDSNIKLISPSILVACKQGHVDDFPWIEWAHLKKGEICKNPKLKLISDSGTLGLDNMKIQCTNCGAINTMKLANSKNAFKQVFPKDISGKFDEEDGFKCKGKLQWKNVKEDCDEIPQMVLRNASNIYFPKIDSSLSIPPFSDEITAKIENSYAFDNLHNNIERNEKRGKLERFMEEDFPDCVEEIAEEIDMEDKIDLVEKIVRRILEASDKASTETRNDYRYSEYEALLNVDEVNDSSKDFKIERKKIEDYAMEELSNIILVKRLREVRALVGFTRLKPPDNFIMGAEDDDSESRLIDLKDKCNNWYPGYEVRGEGIFIELNLEKINEWIYENPEVQRRADKLSKRYNEKRNNVSKREITPKFVLLHTLAHLLIKELSFQCGYSSTSLRERIYCDLPDDEYTMNGILIYTADSDAEGSLGGLVKQGEVENLPRIIKKAIQRAEWCSYDPICIESEGQGIDNLNLAACYSCCLLPETCCEEFNTLLDRAMIVGLLENKKIGFLNKYL
ncbi:DUF1998 domain-containing protein [Clostridium butyricum]|uniref:DUF1998 domain-containing protein n=1 Tax=Clostridium butyricum TaxID=1492 RepID=UPI00136C41C5|nr:DUF1998 domain-containing protein [Clostridium butyricum]MBS5981397.1 DUF1998 domain-containing protein [Clostridium butyricum]MZI80322.1 DUF1998 domain-containing protein [Clostridium butyricum]